MEIENYDPSAFTMARVPGLGKWHLHFLDQGREIGEQYGMEKNERNGGNRQPNEAFGKHGRKDDRCP